MPADVRDVDERRRPPAALLAQPTSTTAPQAAVLPVRALVLHAQSIFADVLGQRLGRQADVEMVGAVTRPARALALVPTCAVDVVVLDWSLPDLEGLLRQLQALSRPPGLLALGDCDEPAEVVAALRAGARAWVPVHGSVDLLLQGLHAVRRGEAWLPPAVLTRVLDHLLTQQRVAEPTPLDLLTERERDVLRCMVAGLDQAAIATRLYLSPNTVRTHRRRTLTKLGVHSSLEAVFIARRAGLTPDPQL